MLYHVAVEGIGTELLRPREDRQRLSRHEPEQEPFAAAMGTIAIDSLLDLTFDGKANRTAMTASRLPDVSPYS